MREFVTLVLRVEVDKCSCQRDCPNITTFLPPSYRGAWGPGIEPPAPSCEARSNPYFFGDLRVLVWVLGWTDSPQASPTSLICRRAPPPPKDGIRGRTGGRGSTRPEGGRAEGGLKKERTFF